MTDAGDFRAHTEQIHPVLNPSASAGVKDLFELVVAEAAVAVEADGAADGVDATFCDLEVVACWDVMVVIFFPEDSF